MLSRVWANCWWISPRSPGGWTLRWSPRGLMYAGPMHAGVDVLLSAHERNYERFPPLDPSGRSDPARGLRDMARWYRNRMRDGVPPNPPPTAFEVIGPDVAAPRNDTDELRITWVGHATFLIQLAGITILTDPIWSRRASPVGWAGPSRLVPPALAFESLPVVDVEIDEGERAAIADDQHVGLAAIVEPDPARPLERQRA